VAITACTQEQNKKVNTGELIFHSGFEPESKVVPGNSDADVEEQGNLYFILDAQDCKLFEDRSQNYTTLWSEINKKVEVPVGRWFTMDYYYKEGDAENGRFYMTIRP
jgi:hypothetical protein